VVVAPLVPIVALATWTARRARRRRLMPAAPAGSMREQIDVVERPLGVRGEAREPGRGWRFPRPVHVPGWLFEAAAGLGLLALPFGALEGPSRLVRYSLGVSLIVPLVAIHAAIVAFKWRRLARIPFVFTGAPMFLLLAGLATQPDSLLGATL